MSVGYVDLHLHLLPGIDDGARTLDDTLAMARALVSVGFSDAAPSPHTLPQFKSRAPEVAALALEQARAALADASIPLTLEVNAENYFLDETLLATLATSARRIGAAGRYLLVEAPYTSPLPALLDLIFRMKLKGVTPLIAHPERCLEFEKKDRAAEAVRSGALLQLDVGALFNRHGKVAQRLAREFLDANLYAVAASDLHSPQDAEEWLSKSLELLHKAVGPKGSATLLDTNPRAILRGDTLP